MELLNVILGVVAGVFTTTTDTITPVRVDVDVDITVNVHMDHPEPYWIKERRNDYVSNHRER